MAITKNNKINIAVIGAGAIGGLVAGYLKLKDGQVSLVARAEQAKAIKDNGLEITGVRGSFHVNIDVSERLNSQPDLVILATKTQDIEAAVKDNLEFMQTSTILTTQNGVQADAIAAKFVPEQNIVSSIVMFGSTSLKPGKIVHNFEGSWIIGKAFKDNDTEVMELCAILNKIFPVIAAEDLSGMKYLKIFVNANNCIPAILGLSMQEAFSDTDISRISIDIWKEGLAIINKCNINLVSLPDFPLERLTKLTDLPSGEAAKIFSGIMHSLSKEPVYGSVLQSIKRGRPSEIDYINGEFVDLAKKNNLCAALNAKLVEMVHRVEDTQRFFSKEELVNSVNNLLN